MNKKILRKLTLSAVTLGVAALSVTTSTFAWFTTNGNASASSVSGKVESQKALMLIKSPTGWNGSTPVYTGATVWDESSAIYSSPESSSAATFGKSTTLINEAGNGTKLNGLKPVSIVSSNSKKDTPDGQFYTNSTNATHTYTTQASSSDYLHYQVVIALSGLVAKTTYTVSMTLPTLNTTTSHKQYLMVDAGTHDNAKAGKTLSLGITDALSLGIKNTVVSGNQSTDTYDLTNGGTYNSSLSDDATGFYHASAETDANNEKGDAIAYYNNVYKGSTSFNNISLPSNYANCYKNKPIEENAQDSDYYFRYWSSTAKTIYSVTPSADGSLVVVTDLYFFIDGWDYQCFNAIGGLDLFANTDSGSTNTIKFECKESNS